MCGIFGYIGGKSNAPSIVLEGLKRLEYRGYDSWGVAGLSGMLTVRKKAGKIGAADVNDMPKSSIAIGHTRWATHGGVTDLNSHPHQDCKKEYVVIHNGIFENYEDYKKILLKKAHMFLSETDTETICHMLENENGSFSEKVEKVFKKMKGLNALIVLNKNSEEIVAVRNGSPLVIGFGKNENFLASDASALLPHTRNVYFMEDYEMAVIKKEVVGIKNIKTGKIIKPKVQTLSWSVVDSEKGNYPDFMLKEIFEQPRVLSEISADTKRYDKLVSIIKKSKGTYLVGCGSASYAALAGTYLFSKVAKMHVNFAVGSEFSYHLDFINKKSLIIPISQSGETMDILEPVKKAISKGAKIASLTNVLGSTLYRESDHKILLGAGPEKAVASTKALTAMIAHLILLSYSLSGKANEGKKALVVTVLSLKKVLSNKSTSNIKKLAGIIKNSKNIYVIGRGLSYPASLEAALKIKEISYIHAEGLAAGELKHGPLALVEKGTPCIAFLPDDETYGANLAGAMEMKARGGYIIGISHKNHEVFDYFLPVTYAGVGTIIPNIAVAQLLAYYITKLKGLDADKPRNLAKSVTVK